MLELQRYCFCLRAFVLFYFSCYFMFMSTSLKTGLKQSSLCVLLPWAFLGQKTSVFLNWTHALFLSDI